jgi:hypothetical protein
MLGVEINDCSCCTGCLTREVTQVCVKGIGSPVESEFYILLGDATGMQGDTSPDPNGVGGKERERLFVGHVVYCCGGGT